VARRLLRWLTPWPVLLLLVGELVLFGGDRREVALVFATVQALGLALLLIVKFPRGATALPAGFLPLALIFALLVFWIGLQLTPFPTGMAQDAWTLIGLRGSPTLDRFATLVELAKLLGLGAVFVLGLLLGREERHATQTYNSLAVAGGAYAAWALAAFYIPALGAVRSGDARLLASVFSPNAAASVFGLFAVIGWTSILFSIRAAFRVEVTWGEAVGDGLRGAWPWLLLCGLCFWALGLTGSRGGAIATLAGLIAAAAAVASAKTTRSSAKGVRGLVAGAAALLVAGAVLVLLSGAPLSSRLGAAHFGDSERWAYLDLYLKGLNNLPWTGYGLGTFHHFNTFMVNSSAASGFWELGAMHNVYLQWVYEAGFPGAALICACIGVVLAKTAISLRRQREGRAWIAASLGVGALFCVHGLVDLDLQIAAIAALWSFVLGAGFGSAHRRARPGRSAKALPEQVEG
jgi:O-antigen ligase